jgi:hypothetical protein
MYLLPQPRRGLGYVPLFMSRNGGYNTNGGSRYLGPRSTMVPAIERPMPGPMPRLLPPPAPTPTPVAVQPAPPPIINWQPPSYRPPITYQPEPPTQQRYPAPPPVGPALGPGPTWGTSPVPANYPRNQLYVASDGAFWQFSPSQNTWVSIGTPYNTGATAAPAPTPGASSAANTATSGATSTAPAPVSVSVTSPSAVTSSYQAVLDWIEKDSLITGVPNWALSLAAALLVFKVSGKKGK